MEIENELKQYELSKFLGFSKEVYGNFERENSTIPIKHLNTLCNFFKVSLDYIFEFTDLSSYKNIHTNINYSLQHSRLKELRRKYNLTQRQLADSIKVSQSTIGDYESKDKPIATPFLYDRCL